MNKTLNRFSESNHKPFKFYADSGHGWLAVKRILLTELGIADKITSFSYQKGKTVYLEEDADVATFFKAYKEAFGCEPRTTEQNHCNGSSPIRSYECYRKE